jgi:hypothetical protein
MITVPRSSIAELESLISKLEEKGIQAEDAAARLNQALGDILTVAADRSRLAHEAHNLLKRIQQEAEQRSAPRS